jgi:HEAT repeat protein
MSVPGSLTLTDSERGRVERARQLAAGGSDGSSELMGMLADPSWVVRRSVVEALSTAGDSAVVAIVESLCDVLVHQRSSEARLAAAVDALVAMRVPVETHVIQLAGSKDPAIVADVVQVLGRRRNSASIPILVQLTRHADDNVAVGSIEALGRIGGRAAVEALIELVGTGNFFRTFPAIDVLGRSGDPRVVEPLAKLLSNSNYLPEAARALGRSGEKAAIQPLIGLLNSTSDSVIRLAAAALSDLRERHDEKSGGQLEAVDAHIRKQIGPEAVRRLTRVLPSVDIPEGVALCRLLGVIGDPAAAQQLTLALDAAPAIAASAAEALARISKGEDDQLLVSIREGSSARRMALLPMVSRQLASSDVAECLMDSNPDVRALACDVLARIGGSSVVSKIFPLLADSNIRVVHAATAAIQSLGTRETRQQAADAARSENPAVRRSALRILGYFGDDGSLQPILDGLKDPDARVREAALQGLPYLDDPRALEALIAETKSTTARTKGLAIRALGQVPKGSERVYSILLKGLWDSDSWVRYYACQAMGRLGYSGASDEIRALLRDEAGQVRVSAVEALSHLDSIGARQALRDAAISDDLDVRRAAIVGLGMAHRAEDLPLVVTALNSSDAPTRLIALSALVNFASPTVLSSLTAAGSDLDEQVRSAAIGFLAARPELEATEVLVEFLLSESRRDRAKAALLIPSQSRVAGLLASLQTASDELAPILMTILSRIDRKEARGALLASMKIPNVAARKAAVAILATRRDSEMTGLLREAAENDPDLAVRNISSLLLRDLA